MTAITMLSVGGFDIECEVEFDAQLVDESFDHAFGTERSQRIEIGDVNGVYPIGDITKQVSCQLCIPSLSRKRRRHWARVASRSIERKLESLDVSITNDWLYDEACNQLY